MNKKVVLENNLPRKKYVFEIVEDFPDTMEKGIVYINGKDDLEVIIASIASDLYVKAEKEGLRLADEGESRGYFVGDLIEESLKQMEINPEIREGTWTIENLTLD